MGRSNNVNRPYVRKSRLGSGTDALQGGAARELLERSAMTERPTVEQLERRQMLFSLAITADSAGADGLGSAVAYFGYFLPYLGTTQTITDTPATTVTEGFDQEAYRAIASGTIFATSALRVFHNVNPGVDLRVTAAPQTNDNNDRFVRANLNETSEFISFRFLNDANLPNSNIAVRRFQASVNPDRSAVGGDNTGLLTNNVSIDLYYNNEIIDSLTGARLRAAIAGPNANLGTGVLTINAPGNAPAFDELRITMLSAPGLGTASAFELDNIQYDVPSASFAGLVTSRAFGAAVRLTGPVGATVTFRDLYGRDMQNSIRFLPNLTPFNPGDANDDGLPDVNDGIGSIRFSGTDSRTSFTMIGGTLGTSQEAPEDWNPDAFRRGQFGPVFWDGLYTMRPTTALVGLYDDFEQAGFGFWYDGDTGAVSGLPGGSGSVIVGAPIVRPLNDYRPEEPSQSGSMALPNGANGVLVYTGWNNPLQGIFVEDGGAIGNINVEGMVFGSSRFGSFVDRLSIGNLMGSVNIAGDLGQAIIAGDAGYYRIDTGNNGSQFGSPTGSRFVVGRTAGAILVGGRSEMTVLIEGDLNSPTTKPQRDGAVYYEIEAMLDAPGTTAGDFITLHNRTSFTSVASAAPFSGGSASPSLFGNTYIRNDSILAAEIISGQSSGIRIKGSLNGADSFNSEDLADVYAFGAGPGDIINLQALSGGAALYFRIMDSDGNLLAAPEQPSNIDGVLLTNLTFRPDAPGVYYLVVTDPTGAAGGTGQVFYNLAVTGLPVATLGGFRSASGMGGVAGASITGFLGNDPFTTTVPAVPSPASISVLSGSVGSVRIGTGYLGSGGVDSDPSEILNTGANGAASADDLMGWQAGILSVAGSLYNITTGADIGTPQGFALANARIVVSVGGDLGSLITGLTPLVDSGLGGASGDMNFITLNVAGRIGFIDVRGGIGMDQDRGGAQRLPLGADSVVINSGLGGGSGDIGLIKVGFHVAGDALTVNTPDGTTIGGVLVSQANSTVYDDADRRSGVYGGIRGIRLNTGVGSDIRFVDLPKSDLINSVNVTYPLIGGQVLELVDDGGSRVNITVEGPTGTTVGRVVVMPVDGSQGVAIGSIIADLSGGRTLRITGLDSTGAGVIGIGHIIVTADGSSAISISGPVEIDVWRIEERAVGGTGGGGATGGFTTIVNSTPRGDIVAADVSALGQLTIDGDLGRTQVPAFGPQLIGPRLGVALALGGAVGDPLGVPGAVIAPNQVTGKVLRGIRDATNAEGSAALEDVGSPFDGILSGLVVRSGNVQQIRARGSVGDVILQGATSVLQLVTANFDNVTAPGGFEGIVGTIFAGNILRVDVGDGIARSNPSPLATTGIFAINNIGDVATGRTGVVTSIQSAIIAGNAVADPPSTIPEGINTVNFVNAQFRHAFIGAHDLDAFWSSFIYRNLDENALQRATAGDIGDVILGSGNFLQSAIHAGNIRTFQLTTGFFDASTLQATSILSTLSVAGFRNSTLEGSIEEFRATRVIASEADRIATTGAMSDTAIDISGRLRTSITAANVVRSTIDVDLELKALTVTNAVRSSRVNTGQLAAMRFADMYSSEVNVSGAIVSMVATGTIGNSRIVVSGPAGRIDSILAGTGISGEIIASGPIVSLVSTAGDINADVTTTTARGDIGTISAGRDLRVRTDISGNVGSLVAGRNIGAAGLSDVMLVRGNLGSLSLPTGVLYSDVRVGGSIATGITLGNATMTDRRQFVSTGGILAFGSIVAVTIFGDFNGDILSYSGGIGTITITNGSFLAGNTIAAFNGSIAGVSIVNGNLDGDVHADLDITLISVAGAPDGIYGDVGGSASTSALADGPDISAGRNIVKFAVAGGDVIEAVVYARQAISSLTVVGNIRNDSRTTGIGSYFAAGDSITAIAVTGNISDASFVAGLIDLGADDRLGGTLQNADTVKAGNIGAISATGRISNATLSAGMNAGADGVYNTADDTTAIGISTVTALTFGTVGSNVSVFGDTLSPAVTADNRFTKGGTSAPHSNSLINSTASLPPPGGVSFNAGVRTFTLTGGGTVTITLVGPGSANFDAGTSTLRLSNTTIASSVSIASSSGTLTNFDVISTDDASLAALAISATLAGDSDIAIDGAITTLSLGRVEGTGNVFVGGDITTLTIAALVGGFFEVRGVTTMTVTGAFGATNALTTGEASFSALSAGTIIISGRMQGLLSVDRDVAGVTLGAVDHGLIRIAGNVGPMTATSVRSSLIAARDSFGTVTVNGEFVDSALVAGLDTGRDGFYGGTGINADVVSNGNIGAVAISGSFAESDIIAGFSRGTDGFYGTGDDVVAQGRSNITSVTIGSNTVGSSRGSESYRIASNGSIGTVRIGGAVFTGTRGNFSLTAPLFAPAPLQVTSLVRGYDAGKFNMTISFNQPVQFSTLSSALFVENVRGDGDARISLIEGVDYTLAFIDSTSSVRIDFSRALSSADLPIRSDRASPGLFRFTLNADLIKARLDGALLDGDGDGFAAASEDYTEDEIVGDAGDRINEIVATSAISRNGAPLSYRVDYYGATSLDLVLDSQQSSDNLPDPNSTYRLRGIIGDHPDHDFIAFPQASDLDIYKVTLRAGQILRLGEVSGNALAVARRLYDANLAIQTPGGTAATIRLPGYVSGNAALSTAADYLIQQTGTYYIVVGAWDASRIPAGPGTTTTQVTLEGNIVSTFAPEPLSTGDYQFNIQIFDDGDSGFVADTDSGDGAVVVNAPAPGTVSGISGQLGNGYTYSFNAATGIMTATNGKGIVSTRDANGRLTSLISAAIGEEGHAGIASDVVSPDADIFHLNGRDAIAIGTKMRITVKLSQIGADLGSIKYGIDQGLASAAPLHDFRGAVQFGLFDTSLATGVADASLVFSSTDFLPYGGTPNTIIAQRGDTSYGYDANGDFFCEFLAPSRAGDSTQASTFAVYIQGIYNTDYQLEVVTDGTGTVEKAVQNVFIELDGGSVDWLEVAGITSVFSGFDIDGLGFNGVALNGQTVRGYLIERLFSNLTSLFQGSGFDVRFSFNAQDFEFQPFSTVYLSSSADPARSLNTIDTGPGFTNDFSDPYPGQGTTAGTPFRNQTFGYSEHSDIFNTDLSDEAVIFVPTFAIQGITPGQAGLDQLTQALTGAVSRRVGELVGLRNSVNNGAAATQLDFMAANSATPAVGSTGTFVLSNTARRLSGNLDSLSNTNFFLGTQNTTSLLDAVLARR